MTINAAITGIVLNKSDNPFLPTTLNEIVDCAIQVREAGAAIVHVHARNPDQSPCFDQEVYCELVERVRKATDLIVCISMSGRFVQDVNKRAAGLAAPPDMASLTTGSMNFITHASVNSPDTIRELARRIYSAGAIPELEIFEAGFINFVNYLIRKEVLHPPYYFNIILGSLGSAPLDLTGLGHMVTLLPPGAIWSAGGLGPMVTSAELSELRPLNFGFQALRSPLLPENILREIARYDPQDAVRVRDMIRSCAGLDQAVKNLVEIYQEVIEEHKRMPPSRYVGHATQQLIRKKLFLRLASTWALLKPSQRQWFKKLPGAGPVLDFIKERFTTPSSRRDQG